MAPLAFAFDARRPIHLKERERERCWKAAASYAWESAMATAASNPKINLISSQHIDGAAVYDRSGKEIGKIDHFMIDMESGRVLYAVVEFCGFMCLHPGHHPLPWTSLKYDRDSRGYFTDVTQDLVESAPDYTDESWLDREWEKRVHQHYAAEPYWQEGAAATR
jgi:hypothetical protein